MELIYLWIEKNRAFKNKGILLNSNYTVTTEVNDDKESIRFDVEEKSGNKSLYNKANIIDSYLLVGKNGSGKSTLLEMLITPFGYNEPYNYVNYFYVMAEKRVEKTFYYVFLYDKEKTAYKKIYINGESLNKGKKYYCSNETEEKCSVDICSVFVKKSGDSYKYSCGKSYKNMSDSEVFKSIINNNELFSEYSIKEIQLSTGMGYANPIRRVNSQEQYACGDSGILIGLYEIYIREILSRIFDQKFTNKIIQGLRDKWNSLKLYEINDVLKEIFKYINENTEYFNEKGIEDVIKNMEENEEKEKDDEKNIKKVKLKLYKSYITDLCEYMDKNKDSIQHYDRTLNFNVEEIINDKSRKCYEFIINLLEKYSGQISLKYGASDGEKAFIQLTACLAEGIMKISTSNDNYIEPRTCYVLLDELETHLHPEWCRKIYFKISELINKIKTEYKFIIYLSTHSPYVISDFTTDHIINLDCEDEKINFKTFGANIYEILKKGMFLTEHIGEYSLNMVREINKIFSKKNICIKERFEKIAEILNFDTKNISFDRKEDLKKVKEKLLYFIDSVGEPLIKMQLEHQWLKLEKEWNNQIEKKDNELISLISNLSDEKKEELISKLKGEMDVKDK